MASITAEEFGHVELVSNTINLLSVGNTFRESGYHSTSKWEGCEKHPPFYFYSSNGYTGDSMGRPWTGDNVLIVEIWF